MKGKSFAVDASVCLKLFVEENLSGKAEAFFERLALDPETRFFVPDLLYLECANALWKYVKRFGYAPDEAKRSLARILEIDLIPLPVEQLAKNALALALDLGVTVYDASYLACAKAARAPLVTADDRLARRAGKGDVRVLRLGDLD